MNSQSDRTSPVDVEGLVWAMLDEQISEQDFRQLDELLRDDEEARRVYLQCVQLHVDLASFYTAKVKTAVPASLGLPIIASVPAIDTTMADSAM